MSELDLDALEKVARESSAESGVETAKANPHEQALIERYWDALTPQRTLRLISHLRELQEENERQGFLLALMGACAEERYVGKDRGQWIRYERLHEVVAEMTAGYRDLSEDAEALASTYREENERLREGLERADAAEPFFRLAREVINPESGDRPWHADSKDWLVVFSFAGQSITLGDLRRAAIASTRTGDTK